VASPVFLHVGLPKTGTTYLQTILWKNRDELRRQGILLPGFGPRQHLWASGAVREEPNLSSRHLDAPRAWDELVQEVNAWDGPALISHEFFAGASAEQTARAVAALAGAQVHVVVTARDTLEEYVVHFSVIRGNPPNTITHDRKVVRQVAFRAGAEKFEIDPEVLHDAPVVSLEASRKRHERRHHSVRDSGGAHVVEVGAQSDFQVVALRSYW